MLAYIPAPWILWVEKLPISATNGDRLRWRSAVSSAFAALDLSTGGSPRPKIWRSRRPIEIGWEEWEDHLTDRKRLPYYVTVYSLRTWTSPIEIDDLQWFTSNGGFPVRYVSSTQNGGSIPHGESIDQSLGFPINDSIPPRWSLRWSLSPSCYRFILLGC